MSKSDDKKLIVGLDIGTSKVVAIVGAIEDDGTLNISGYGKSASKGMKKGVVVNIESTVASIRRAIEEAELMAGCDIRSVYAGIAGSHINSMNSNGVVAIKDGEVTQQDIDRVIDAARAVKIPADQRILHILPQEYEIDSQDGVTEPIGMSGVRLEAKVHLVHGAVSATQNITKCVARCGLETEDVILEQLASSYACLTEDEKELGVCMVDIGGGTTDIAIFTGGAIRHTAVIPIAGDQATNDIAVALRTPTQFAEDIKVKYACVLPQLVNSEETIEVPSVGDRESRRMSRHVLADVLHDRYSELFDLVDKTIVQAGFKEMIPAGIVLTGGGSKIEGALELAEEVMGVQVRRGIPQGIGGLADIVKNPIFSTGVGLLLYGKEDHDERSERDTQSLGGIFERMKNWFKGF